MFQSEEGKNIVPNAVIQYDAFHSFSNSLQKNAKNLMPEIQEINPIYGNIEFENIQSYKTIKKDFPYIFSARRLVYSKGIDILINAFDKVKDQLPKHKLLIAGDGPEKEKLVRQAKDWGMEKRVIFLGSLPFEEVCGYMKGADAHICPSRTEGGGLVNITAAACGCPSIGSNVDGIPEYILDGTTGSLFESEDSASLARQIVETVNNTPKDEIVTRRCIEFGRKFDSSYIFEKLLQFYDDTSSEELPAFKPWSELTEELYKRSTEQ